MRAIWLTGQGGIESFEMRESPDPTPGPGEVRVRARAAGLNFADLLMSQGMYPGAPKPPCVLGYESAGIVDAVGEGADSKWIGKRVIAMTNLGGLAEFACVRQSQILGLTDSLPFEQAAAIPVTWVTAYHMLFRVGCVRRGESVLVHMAAGGVGTAVLQLCRTIGGVETFGTASAAKHSVISALGCAHPIDYHALDYRDEVLRLTGGKGVDVVLDPLGGADTKKGYDLLKPGGRLICYGFANLIRGEKRNWLRLAREVRSVPKFSPLDLMSKNRTVAGVHMGRFGADPRVTEELGEVLRLIASGAATPIVDAVLPFERFREAYHRLKDGKNVGKVVLVV